MGNILFEATKIQLADKFISAMFLTAKPIMVPFGLQL